MTATPETVAVEQQDRDAAAFVCRRWSADVLGMIRSGKFDQMPEVQAFARHRQNTEAQIRASQREGDAGLNDAEKLALQRVQVVADASCLPATKEAHQSDLRVLLALVRRLYTDLALCRTPGAGEVERKNEGQDDA